MMKYLTLFLSIILSSLLFSACNKNKEYCWECERRNQANGDLIGYSTPCGWTESKAEEYEREHTDTVFSAWEIQVTMNCYKKLQNKPTGEVFGSDLYKPTIEELQTFYEGGYHTILGNVTIFGTDVLISLQGLSNVDSIYGEVHIYENSDLNSMEGLNNLQFVGSDFAINNNESLKNLDGLNNLQTIGSDLIIVQNEKLENIRSLDKLNSVKTNLIITNNSLLSDFCNIKNLLIINGVDGEVIIEENKFNPSVEDIINGDCKEE